MACTSSQVRPRLAVNSTFGFEKMFVVDHNMASGVLFILVDGAKPTKSSKENNYVRATQQLRGRTVLMDWSSDIRSSRGSREGASAREHLYHCTSWNVLCTSK